MDIDTRDKEGKFSKGVSGNLKGRPKKNRPDQDKLDLIYLEANGDPILFQQLVLRNGAALALDLNIALKLAKELAPYEKPRLASIETKEDRTTTFLIVDPTRDSKSSIITQEHLKIATDSSNLE